MLCAVPSSRRGDPGRAGTLGATLVDPAPTEDDCAPICPACGVTQLLADEAEPRFVCLECGFADDCDD